MRELVAGLSKLEKLDQDRKNSVPGRNKSTRIMLPGLRALITRI